jgi:hypothetical protein
MRSLCRHQSISRLVQARGTIQKNAKCCRFSSAAVKGIDDGDHLIDEEKKNLNGLFPWRSMPAMPEKTIQERLSHQACTYLLREHYLNGTSAISPGSVSNSFFCCTSAISSHPNKHLRLLWMNQSFKRKSLIHQSLFILLG